MVSSTSILRRNDSNDNFTAVNIDPTNVHRQQQQQHQYSPSNGSNNIANELRSTSSSPPPLPPPPYRPARSVRFDLPDEDYIIDSRATATATSSRRHHHHHHPSNTIISATAAVDPYKISMVDEYRHLNQHRPRQPPPPYQEATAPLPAIPIRRPHMDFVRVNYPRDIANAAAATATTAATTTTTTTTAASDVPGMTCVVLDKTTVNSRNGICTEYRTSETFYVDDNVSIDDNHSTAGYDWIFGPCHHAFWVNFVRVFMVMLVLSLTGLWIWYIQVIHQHNALLYTTRGAEKIQHQPHDLTVSKLLSDKPYTIASPNRFAHTRENENTVAADDADVAAAAIIDAVKTTTLPPTTTSRTTTSQPTDQKNTILTLRKRLDNIAESN